MKDYVVQSGPLRTFESLFDPRLEKFRKISDYHTIELLARPGTRRLYMSDLKRTPDLEVRFTESLFSGLASGHRTIFGLRDVTHGRAWLLYRALEDQKALRWSAMKYGVVEDDLVLVELRNFSGDFDFLKGFAPPKAGEMFFLLTSAPLDVHEIYWQRAARASLRTKDDPFRRDAVAQAADAKVILYQDARGSYTLVLHPGAGVPEALEKRIREAGVKAGLSITFAPGLFG